MGINTLALLRLEYDQEAPNFTLVPIGTNLPGFDPRLEYSITG